VKNGNQQNKNEHEITPSVLAIPKKILYLKINPKNFLRSCVLNTLLCCSTIPLFLPTCTLKAV